MDDVLVPVGGVEGVILFGAEAEEDVALEHVDPQRVHRGDHRVNADVELEREAGKYSKLNLELEALPNLSLAHCKEVSPDTEEISSEILS